MRGWDRNTLGNHVRDKASGWNCMTPTQQPPGLPARFKAFEIQQAD